MGQLNAEASLLMSGRVVKGSHLDMLGESGTAVHPSTSLRWHNSGIPYTPYTFRVRIRIRIRVRVRIRIRVRVRIRVRDYS